MSRFTRRRSPEFCDDIQGPRRAQIIAEHLRWLEMRQQEPARNLSEYPLAKFAEQHIKRLSMRRMLLADRQSEQRTEAYRKRKRTD